MSEKLSEEQSRIDKAEADAKIAEAKAREAAAKQKINDTKAKGREKKVSTIKKIPKTIKIVIIVVIVAAIIFCAGILPGIVSSFGKGTTVSEATLKQAVEVSKLSTAQFSYKGIAEKYDGDNVSYYIYYEATANAGIDMENIEFSIDKGSKVIRITLPPITVNNPIIDESKFEYLPRDANIDIKEAFEICKADVQTEISNSENITEVATRNLHSTLEALLLPLIEDSGYSIEWSSSKDDIEVGDNNENN